MKELDAWGNKSKFRYKGSVLTGTTIYFGKDFKSKETISREHYQSLIRNFKGKLIHIGTTQTDPLSGNIAEWLKENITSKAIAPCLGEILVSEGFALKNKSEIYVK